ncbi:MAG: hypothetical protein PHR87_10750 [Sulfurospirillaceae bacterium]|nr:hypothetical protein [Sulfurospirillaceae bacterium]
MISTLQNLAGIGSKIVDTPSTSINFNANLPICVEVLKKLDLGRYKLKLGRRELTTKSQKQLKEGKKYWGNLSQGKGGILTISNLCIQPETFQTYDTFLSQEDANIIESTVLEKTNFKNFLLHQLSEASISKEQFNIFSYMLLALHKGVFHLPFLFENKKTLLQFKYITTAQNEKSLLFYAAFENLGPLEGSIEKVHSQLVLNLHAIFEKSLFYLEKELNNWKILTKLSLKNEISPLYDTHDLILDLKG